MAIAGGAIHSTVQWTIFTLLGAFAVDKKFSSFHVFFLYRSRKVETGKWGKGKAREVRVKEKGESLFIVRPNVFTPGSTAGWL